MSTVHAILHLLEPSKEEVVPARYIRQTTLEKEIALDFSTVKLPLIAGGYLDWPTALPHAWLPCCLRVPAFRDISMQSCAKHPSSFQRPWNLVLYLDEITPGNVLRPDNKRKITAFYASLLEFDDFLRYEAAWMTLGTLRTGVVKNIKGGMSNVVRQLLRAMFLGATSLSHGGLALGSDVGIFRSLPSVAER